MVYGLNESRQEPDIPGTHLSVMQSVPVKEFRSSLHSFSLLDRKHIKYHETTKALNRDIDIYTHGYIDS